MKVERVLQQYNASRHTSSRSNKKFKAGDGMQELDKGLDKLSEDRHEVYKVSDGTQEADKT